MCSLTTAERQSLASRDRTCCLRRCLPARPLRFYGFRGSIAHPTQSLCTLRTRRCRRPRNTRYRAPATAYPDRSLTGRTTPAFLAHKQSIAVIRRVDCFVASLPGNDGSGASIRMSNSGYTSAFSRREAPEVCVSLSLKRGSRECRMRAAPAVSRAKGRTKIAHEHTGQRRQSDIPCAMALRLTSRSPRSIGLSCLRRLTETGTLARLGFRTSVET